MGIQRILLAIAIVLVGGGGVFSGAALDDVGDGSDPDRRSPLGSVLGPKPPKVTLSYQPGAGAAPVSPTTPLSVRAAEGELREVTLTAPDGGRVQGTLSPDRTTWTSGQPLTFNTRYTWGGTAADSDGAMVPVAGTVATVKPTKLVRGQLNIRDGRTVGVAAPIILQFNAHVSDRAAVEKALTVTTPGDVEGAWGWLPDEAGGSRVIWRPREYWPANTKVTVTAKLFGVPYGGGAYGSSDVSSTFTVGRSLVTRADVKSFQLVVVKDGAQVAAYPASYGLDSDPNRNTRTGVHVITEKFTDKRMRSEQYGYDVMEKWAVRMSNNGEFIHANPATTGVQGSSNVSHGCVNLSTQDARAYYDMAIYGDPVEVTGSGVNLSAKDGDIWVWTLDWVQWTNLSAVD
ncbi:MAG TPA: Ig-like domain-containing protein [Pseudonocardia sp.]